MLQQMSNDSKQSAGISETSTRKEKIMKAKVLTVILLIATAQNTSIEDNSMNIEASFMNFIRSCETLEDPPVIIKAVITPHMTSQDKASHRKVLYLLPVVFLSFLPILYRIYIIHGKGG